MADIVVLGSVARDEIVKLHEPLREGTHLSGAWRGPRLGGGAACTGVPLVRAGHHVTIVGSIGQDELGRDLMAALVESGLDTSQMRPVDQPSTRSIILVDGDGERTVINVMRSHEEEPPSRLLDLRADCVYVRSRRRDLAPLLREKAETSLLIAHVPPSTSGARPAHILVASASDVTGELLADPWTAGKEIGGDLLQWMIVTHGADGVAAYAEDQVLRVPAKPVVPIDTTGAGDSFAAGLVHALMSGATMPDALETAVAWGSEATQYESSILPEAAIAQLLSSGRAS